MTIDLEAGGKNRPARFIAHQDRKFGRIDPHNFIGRNICQRPQRQAAHRVVVGAGSTAKRRQ